MKLRHYLGDVLNFDAWHEYDRWNEALAQHLFSTDCADTPVYIDVDTETLSRVVAQLELDIADPLQRLVDVVRGTLSWQDGDVFGEHTRRFLTWRRQFSRENAPRTKASGATELAPPPVLGLLCVLVMAAERMGSDSNLATNAYYPRLAEVLGVNGREQSRLKAGFPRTEQYWRGLNEYLEANEGQVGLPTAYALNYRYVGIPQSQALVRAVDRAKLPDFFGMFGLTPGSELIIADLERLLDTWISKTPPAVTTNLRHLWTKPSAREKVAGVVAVELALWDGTFRAGTDTATRSAGEIQLTALVRQNFGSRSVELSFVARLPRPVEADQMIIKSAEGAPRIGVVPAAGARLRPVPGSKLDASSLVGAILEFHEPVSEQTVARRPRRVVPLRRDELLGNLAETDRVQLADDVVLLVKDEESLVGAVLDVVEKYGHRGTLFRSEAKGGDVALPGLPDGWVLIDDVQIYAIPQDIKRLDLHVLVPLTTAQLNFSGGLKMPGRIRKWSSLDPPEIRAAVAEAETMAISLYDLMGEEPTLLEHWADSSCAMAVPLTGLDLADGDYEVALEVNSEVISRQTLRLRSGDSPDAMTWENCARLNYELDAGAIAALSAVEAVENSELVVDGLQTIGSQGSNLTSMPVPSGLGWKKPSASTADRPTVVLGTADPKSCLMTGAHRLQLPTWHGGRSKGQIEGVCTGCGLRKTMPARPRWTKHGSPVAVPALNLTLTRLPTHTELGVSRDSCLDALIHVGGGTLGAFERVASQAEGGALFLDQFLRSLEALGHIDVRRDSQLQPVEWEANPAYLAETMNNGFVLAGVWSEDARRALRLHLEKTGALLAAEGGDHELTAWFARGVDARELESIIDLIGLSATVVPDAARRMLAALPPLSAVELELPRIPIPQYSKATIFKLDSASWEKTPGVGVPGAYRLEQSFRSLSLYIDSAGALERYARLGTVQLVKHLAARHAGRPLLAYHEAQSMLLTPMGADLPGLYGRVASLCSGLPATTSTSTRSVVYRDVPLDIADALNTLLSN